MEKKNQVIVETLEPQITEKGQRYFRIPLEIGLYRQFVQDNNIPLYNQFGQPVFSIDCHAYAIDDDGRVLMSDSLPIIYN